MISIIIPVYNGQSTLDQCLNAILDSQHRDFECIVVDDSSTDGTVKIAGQYPVRMI